MLPQEIDRFLQTVPNDQKAIVQAILMTSRIDEVKIVDDILSDINTNRSRYFDILYIDLSIDRSAKPLIIDGSGTLINAVEASDDLANLSIAFTQDSTSETRLTMKDGKRFFVPYTRLVIYNDVQAGKYIKLLRGREMPSLRVGSEDDSGESANSDLVTALGNSSSFTTGQIAVGTSSTLIKAANSSRKRIKITNNDLATALYVGVSGVTITNGDYIPAGGSIVINTTTAIYGVGASAITASYIEE